MLTRLRIRNFKTLGDVDIPLGQNVVLIGPNNSGKTSVLQALALWQTGLREWSSRRTGTSQAKQRVGVTVNRKALTHTPVSDARRLWHDLKVNLSQRVNGSQDTKNIYLDVIVDGENGGTAWTCGLEFYYANPESIYCRPLRESGDGGQQMEDFKRAAQTRVAALPPMSGLASEEPELQPGRIAVLLGEGQTAQVLRNLCFQVHQFDTKSSAAAWPKIAERMKGIFGMRLFEPSRDSARGTIDLSYEENGVELDLSSAGRGAQQTLLLLAHLYANPKSVLLLDEPDAHLEILRQRQIYSLITDTARATGSQIIAASHSEVVLNEAADKDVVIAFVGKPHRMDDRASQVLKSLKEIGFDQYYQAEQKGFVIYLEGATDLAILSAFARKLDHEAAAVLDDPFVHYVLNQPKLAEHHFFGLREAKPDLEGVAIFDRLDKGLPSGFSIPSKCWSRREIENYLCSRQVLLRYARGMEPDDLVGRAMQQQREDAMNAAIKTVEDAIRVLGRDPWSPDEKVSDEFLPNVFKRYFESIRGDNRLNKSDFHLLADFVEPEEIDAEITQALDLIVEVSKRAKPRG
jgi:ABC-type transport system involved in cytochrome c biogenesis ATPase subunit